MNHPVIDFGYRIDCGGKSVFFTGDHEPPYNIYEPGDEAYMEYQGFVNDKQAAIHQAMQGVDVLIADSSYTDAEYASKKGWGHGTFDTSIQSAIKAGAKVLFCTHHEPTRSDEQLEAVFADVMGRYASRLNGLQVFLAYEGLTVELAGA